MDKDGQPHDDAHKARCGCVDEKSKGVGVGDKERESLNLHA